MNGITQMLGPAEYLIAFTLCLLLPHLGKFVGRFVESPLLTKLLFFGQSVLCFSVFFSFFKFGPCLLSLGILLAWTFVSGICSRSIADLLAPMVVSDKEKAAKLRRCALGVMLVLVLGSAALTNLNLVSGIYAFMGCILDFVERSGFRMAALLEPHSAKKSIWPLLAGIMRVVTVLLGLVILVSPLWLLHTGVDIAQMMHCVLMSEGMRQLYRALVAPKASAHPRRRIV